MNKENLSIYLKTAYIPFSKELVSANLLFSFCANIALLLFFRNIYASIVSSILFIAYVIVFFRNKRYLREYYNSLLVSVWLLGYLFWLLLIFTILLEIFFDIGFWYYTFEAVMMIFCVIYTTKRLNKTFAKGEFKINFSGYNKNYFLITMAAYVSIHLFFVIFKPPFIENVAWYLISSIVFLITLLFEAAFVSQIFVLFGYLKYFENSQ